MYITDFQVKRLDINDIPLELFTFMEECKEQEIKNNVSLEAMKIGMWGQDEAWWCVWVNNKIVSISGCHRMDEYQKGCWRIGVRSATLKDYRGRAPKDPTLADKKTGLKNDFVWQYIVPLQKQYVKVMGASLIVSTTNLDNDKGDSDSVKMNKFVSKVMVKQGLFRLHKENADIFYVKQNVWEHIF